MKDARIVAAHQWGRYAPFTLAVMFGFVFPFVGCTKQTGPDAPPAGQSSHLSTQARAEASAKAPKSRTEKELLSRARQEMQRGDVDSARRYLREFLVGLPDDRDLIQNAAELFVSLGDIGDAVQLYGDLVASADVPSKELLYGYARGLMQQGRPFETVEVLRQAVAAYPNDASARRDLAGLLASLGLQSEAGEHLRWLVQRGFGGPQELVILSDLTRPQTDEKTCEYALENYPEDQRPRYSLAVKAAHSGKWDEVAGHCQRLLETHPTFVPGIALYGRVIVERHPASGSDSNWLSWKAALPETIEKYPDYWHALGGNSLRQNDDEEAAFAFWKAGLLNENDTEAIHQLTNCLAKLGIEDAWRSELAERIDGISRLRQLVDLISLNQLNSQKTAVEISSVLVSLGRLWEAASWLRAGSKMTSDLEPELGDRYRDVRAKMTSKTPWMLATSRVVGSRDLSAFDSSGKEDRVALSDNPAPAMNANTESAPTAIRFKDEASKRALHHRCVISKPDGEESDLWIYQSIAGGAAVLDFDCDGWPDFYFTSMDGQPMKSDSQPNHLYRNLQSRFERCTEYASVGDRGFSQGVAVGDFNSDGFPDLMVSNIGVNRLYQNNGDGTFREVAKERGLGGEDWTTSVALADVDLDGVMDVFEVGYCRGDLPFQSKCTRDGFTRTCSPLSFPAQPDRVWKGTENGRFIDFSSNWLVGQQPSYGLAILVGQFDAAPGLDLFVANDMAPNHFWSTRNDGSDDFRLSEQAAIAGVAVDERSRRQASMGMTVGDPDHDGDFDFFITNHANESNTYYEQVHPGTWIDQTRKVGLRESSIPMLGFGTTWFDADNDGELELLVCNGHVDDFSHLGEPLRMPMQLYRRHVNGRWNLLPVSDIGEPMAKKRVARNVVLADVDRDGRTDAAVTGLFDPVALLMNDSEVRGQSVSVYLRGTSSHRDAVGSIVTAKIGERLLRQQLIAGDGFQCSSEKCLRFAVPENTSIEQVTVQWPGGRISQYETLMQSGRILLIENESEPYSY
ncbi:tetratricopeptide (TPR) repeat protein [Rhodopirellula rubra]|uniref:Tetratricopeptide (TPR) repeat protein n=1 Tax=Aporhodopirellula rubra TaxID=980271 RepID=A0A7W5H7Y2_9BACT|nr:CRTAC1 family protein [Aporhodopirellula rubra]MBB3208869.1 tetratricopeptide (TPR) repeat protein [Aporhodopirellula rubra]